MALRISFTIAATGLAVLAGCAAKTKDQPTTPKTAATAAPKTAVLPPSGPRTIILPSLPPDLPDGPGKQVVLDRCVVCHSPRYIMIQPTFSRSVWTAEVDKMRKTFGAPVADEQVEAIVNYLVAIRGTPADAATKPTQ